MPKPSHVHGVFCVVPIFFARVSEVYTELATLADESLPLCLSAGTLSFPGPKQDFAPLQQKSRTSAPISEPRVESAVKKR